MWYPIKFIGKLIFVFFILVFYVIFAVIVSILFFNFDKAKESWDDINRIYEGANHSSRHCNVAQGKTIFHWLFNLSGKYWFCRED